MERLLILIGGIIAVTLTFRELYLKDREKKRKVKIKNKEEPIIMNRMLDFYEHMERNTLQLIEEFDFQNNVLDMSLYEMINNNLNKKISYDYSGINYELEFDYESLNNFFVYIKFDNIKRKLVHIRMDTNTNPSYYIGLARIYVAPHFRRCNIAETSILYLAKKAFEKGYIVMDLEVGGYVEEGFYMDDILGDVNKNSSKEDAIKFYEKLGFLKSDISEDSEYYIPEYMSIEIEKLINNIENNLKNKNCLVIN